MPDDAPWTDPVVVPDDLRELQAEIDAYHREQRLAARRRRLRRLTGSRTWRRLGLPLVVTGGALALAAVVFAVLTFGQPRGPLGPTPQPIATAPAADPGEVGGLLPAVGVRTSLGESSLREWRPMLMALVPMHCDCTSLLSDLSAQAEEAQVSLAVVAPAAQDAEVAALPGQMHRGRVIPLYDPTGAIGTTYAAQGVTVLVVAPDATVTYLARDVQPGEHFETPLQQMVTSLETTSA